ncbi:hypothetical protein GCM10009789_86900 [Kribbella sancticallisti]|uniref:Uncharacterized protein n=1 Tax=Kribbella sancticallisti TaxID=460087 RepID=A0ABN2EW44_9ACTN
MTQQSLSEVLFVWANSNAMLTGRIKELALAERDPGGTTGLTRQAALGAAAEAIRAVEAARSDVSRAYRDLRVDVPQEFRVDPSS